MTARALYLHVPFCARKCAYCDFASFETPREDPLMDAYAASLKLLVFESLDTGILGTGGTAYVGGGTPTMLGDALPDLIASVRRHSAPCELTYEANPSQDDSKTGLNQGFDKQTVSSDELQAIMNDYNAQFGTSFGTDNFGAYYDDINERMKKRKEGMEPIDLLMVVGMFLTGFDAKKLNTLYVDKNLEYHGLLQAFSRTNRVLNEKKRFGKILCFRDLKSNVDESLKLFCNGNPNEGVKRPEFKQVKKELNELSEAFLQKYPTMESVDALKSEYDKKKFLLAFREIIKKRAEIQIYEDFDADDPGLILSEQDYNDYRSKYLDMTVGFVKEEAKKRTGIFPGPI